MSMTYWMNEGIGIRASRLYPHLDTHKCYAVISQLFPDETIEESEFNLDDFVHGGDMDIYGLGDFMCLVDGTNTFDYGDDGDSEEYFLYCPSYPWQRKSNEPSSIEEVHKRIIDAVLKVTNLSRDQADALIDDDIYDYGCG